MYYVLSRAVRIMWGSEWKVRVSGLALWRQRKPMVGAMGKISEVGSVGKEVERWWCVQ